MKIFISIHQLTNIGGATPSTLNLLNEISQIHEVTLCTLGRNLKAEEIPEKVTLVQGSNWYFESMAPRIDLKSKKLYIRLRSLYRRLLKRVFGVEFIMNRVVKELNFKEDYDVAIAYGNCIYNANGLRVNGGDVDVILKCVNSKKKVEWMHNDPIQLGYTREICLREYEMLDAIVCVSDDNKRILSEVCPDYKHKFHTVYNMYNIRRIKSMSAKEGNPFAASDKKFHFVTVARINNQQKRIDRIVEVCQRLEREGYDNYDWTIVGDGPDRNDIESSIAEKKVKTLILVGLQSNPYPYMLHASASVLTSAYEGYSMVVKEAQVLGTPTVITNYDAAYEAMKNGCEGLICDNSTKGVYTAIKSILDNPEQLKIYRKYLEDNPVNNNVALKQFEEVISIEN